MAAGMKHYFKDGVEYKGATHKDAKGNLMSGAKHVLSSRYLYHKNALSDTAKKKTKK